MTSSNSHNSFKQQPQIGIDSVGGPFSYINSDYQYEYANDSFERFIDRGAGEIIGKTVSELFGVEIGSTLRTELALALNGECRKVVLEFEDHPSGARFIQYTFKPNSNRKGVVKGVFVTERDCSYEQFVKGIITSGNDDIVNSLELLSIIFNESSDFVFVLKVNKDEGLTYHTLNKNAAAMLRSYGKYENGYEVLGKSIEEVMVERLQYSDDAYQLRLKKFKEVQDTKKQVVFETKTVSTDKSIMYHQNTFIPTLDKDDNVEYIIVNIRDVTESCTAKQQSEENASQLSKIYNNTDDIMVLVKVEPDHKYIIQTCNDAYNYYGISQGYFERSDHCIGLDVIDMLTNLFKVSEYQISTRKANWIECEESKSVIKYNIKTKLEGGDHLHHEMTLSPILDANGVCTHILSVAKDVTEYQEVLRNLRETEERYKSVVTDQTDYIVRWKKGGIRTFVNDAYCRRFGIERNDAIGTSFYNLIPDFAREEALARQATLSWKNPKIITTHPVDRLDGSKGWEQWTERALFDENGNIREYQSVGTDVTEILVNREKLRTQKQELETLIDNVPGLVYRHQLDKFWTLEFISDASREIIGYSADKLKGRQIKKLLANEEDWPELDKKIALAVDTKETCIMQHRLRKSDGSLIWVLNRYKCVYDENDNPKFIDGVVIDISAQKMAEQNLIKNQGLLSTIYNGTKNALMLIEVAAEGNFKIVSGNKVYRNWMRERGYTEEQYLNKDIRTCLLCPCGNSKKEALEMEAECRKVINSDQPSFSVIENRTADGKLIYLEKSLTAVRNEEGVCTHILESLKDITSQKITELELKENENRLSLIYNTSKDFMALLRVQDVGFSIESVNKVYEDLIIDTMTDPFTNKEVVDMQVTYFLSKGLGLTEAQIKYRVDYMNEARDSEREVSFNSMRMTPGGEWHRRHCLTPVIKDGVCTHLLWVSSGINETVIAERKLKVAFEEVKKLKQQLERENYYLKEEVKLQNNFEDMVFTSSVFKNVLTKVEQVANLDVNVLISGETGTGKELIARAIHNLSERRARPMIKLNCGAIPRELVESELFGHEKGAFTGAHEKKTGKFELANGSTIFLDEIGEMPLDIQVKLLRVLQESKFERVGGNETIEVDVRVIAATNRNLKAESEEGKFRRDLFYRLNVFPLHLPPLKERVEDIPLLVEFFIEKFSSKHQRPISYLSQEVMDSLHSYSWPGNVRELENMIERAVITSIDGKIEIAELRNYASSESKTKIKSSGSKKTLAEIERAHILITLQENDWKIAGVNGAANVLGLKPSTLRDRMKKLDLKRPIAF